MTDLSESVVDVGERISKHSAQAAVLRLLGALIDTEALSSEFLTAMLMWVRKDKPLGKPFVYRSKIIIEILAP